MTDIRIARLNITINLIKILSIWGATIVLVFKMGTIYADFKIKLATYDAVVIRVDSLEKWKQTVEAYYVKPEMKTIK